jgi:hypothetical protein
MNFAAHSIAEGFVDALVAGDAAGAFEFRRHDGREEMPAIAFDLDVLANQPMRNETLDFVGGGIGHDAAILAVRAQPPLNA